MDNYAPDPFERFAQDDFYTFDGVGDAILYPATTSAVFTNVGDYLEAIFTRTNTNHNLWIANSGNLLQLTSDTNFRLTDTEEPGSPVNVAINSLADVDLIYLRLERIDASNLTLTINGDTYNVPYSFTMDIVGWGRAWNSFGYFAGTLFYADVNGTSYSTVSDYSTSTIEGSPITTLTARESLDSLNKYFVYNGTDSYTRFTDPVLNVFSSVGDFIEVHMVPETLSLDSIVLCSNARLIYFQSATELRIYTSDLTFRIIDITSANVTINSLVTIKIERTTASNLQVTVNGEVYNVTDTGQIEQVRGFGKAWNDIQYMQGIISYANINGQKYTTLDSYVTTKNFNCEEKLSTEDPSENVDILHIWGQSNARGVTGDVSTVLPYKYRGDIKGAYLSAASDLQTLNYPNFNDNGSNQIGPELSLARKYLNRIKKAAFLVKTAVSGSSLAVDWVTGGANYNAMIADMQRMIDKVYNPKTYYMYANQGESDADDLTEATNWDTNFVNFITDQQTALSITYSGIAIARLATNLVSITYEAELRQSQEDVANISSLAGITDIINQDDLSLFDTVHFDYESQLKLGIRAFHALIANP